MIMWLFEVGKHFVWRCGRFDCRGAANLIVAQQRSDAILDCGVGWRTSGTALTVESGAAAIALNVHLQDGGVMNEAVDGGERHGLIGEHLAPFAEGLVGGDQ